MNAINEASCDPTSARGPLSISLGPGWRLSGGASRLAGMSWVSPPLVAFVLLVGSITHAAGDRPTVHTVYPGQRLGSIAKRYQVSVEALSYANGISPSDIIRPGQELVIPDRSDSDGSRARKLRGAESRQAGEGSNGEEKAVTSEVSEPRDRSPEETQDRRALKHTVYPGQRLGGIAKRYGVSIQALCEANGIRRKAIITPGQELIIPGRFEPARTGGTARPARREGRTTANPQPPKKRRARSWSPYVASPRHSGYVNIVGHHSSWKGYLTGKKGRVLPAARRAASRVLAWPRQDKLIDVRLLGLLARVSDTFGGRALRVVSGWRMTSFARESRHKLGRAVDFRVVGVPNEALRDYVRTFSDVGVGYYPNSTFIHLDVRDAPAYWVDYAGPGEAPRYRKPIATAARATGEGPEDRGVPSAASAPATAEAAEGRTVAPADSTIEATGDVPERPAETESTSQEAAD